MEPPKTRYAKAADAHIAYQVFGDGPRDLVYVPPFISHVELMWEEPLVERFLRRLATFARVIVFDRRGAGLSDPLPAGELPSLAGRMDDIIAVLEATECSRAAVMGASESGTAAALFAATYPERVTALILWASFARAIKEDGYPEGWIEREEIPARLAAVEQAWSEGVVGGAHGPANSESEATLRRFRQMARASVSVGTVLDLYRFYTTEVDVRPVISAIQAPTLVMVPEEDENAPASRWMAEHIAGARYVEMPGGEHSLMLGPNADEALQLIEEFLTGARRFVEPNRALLTLLMTDIVDSTRTAADVGDTRWRALLDSHNELVRAELERFGGREIDTTGDGFLAAFDGPARAIGCARAIVLGVVNLGLAVRAGIHTGECELTDDGLAGIAVHVVARVAAAAGRSEVLVSDTVKDLVAGSAIAFSDRGMHELKGVPEARRLYAVQI